MLNRAAVVLLLLLGCASQPKTGLSDEEIDEVLSQHGADVRGCMAEQKAADPAVRGKMRMTYKIEPNGRTSSHALTPEEFAGTELESCLRDKMLAWTFPVFEGDAKEMSFTLRIP